MTRSSGSVSAEFSECVSEFCCEERTRDSVKRCEVSSSENM